MQVPLKVLAPQIEKAKLVLITGHYGSGKTEFSVNLALRAAECPQKLALADLDIVNPYFRSRERKEQLDARDVYKRQMPRWAQVLSMSSKRAA